MENEWKMKTEYIDGEKVYLEQRCDMGGLKSNWNFLDGTYQICRHRDIVKALNRLFKEAESNPNDVNRSMWSLIHSMNLFFDPQFRVPIEVVGKESVSSREGEKARKPRLYTGRKRGQNNGGLTIIVGEKYVPPKKHKAFTDEFTAFLEKRKNVTL